MTIEHLDKTLRVFYDTKELYLYIHNVHNELLKTYPDLITRQTLLIIQKLARDGYITIEIQDDVLELTNGGFEKHTNIEGYHISFEGIMIIDTLPSKYENKPYAYLQEIERKKKMQERNENWPKRNWFLYDLLKSFITAVIGGLIGFMLSYLYIHPKQPQPTLQSNKQTSTNIPSKSSIIIE